MLKCLSNGCPKRHELRVRGCIRLFLKHAEQPIIRCIQIWRTIRLNLLRYNQGKILVQASFHGNHATMRQSREGYHLCWLITTIFIFSTHTFYRTCLLCQTPLFSSRLHHWKSRADVCILEINVFWLKIRVGRITKRLSRSKSLINIKFESEVKPSLRFPHAVKPRKGQIIPLVGIHHLELQWEYYLIRWRWCKFSIQLSLESCSD